MLLASFGSRGPNTDPDQGNQAAAVCPGCSCLWLSQLPAICISLDFSSRDVPRIVLCEHTGRVSGVHVYVWRACVCVEMSNSFFTESMYLGHVALETQHGLARL